MTGIELGVVLDASSVRTDTTSDDLVALARRAEERGLDLVVIIGSDRSPGATDDAADRTMLDTWTTATYLASSTERISIGVPGRRGQPTNPADPEAEVPAVIAKAVETVDILAPGRLLVEETGWTVAPRGAGADVIEKLGAAGLPVVVPVDSATEIDRLAELSFPTKEPNGRRRRSTAARLRRVPGIDYDAVPASVADTAVEPGDAAYGSVSSTYLRGGAPGIVLRPRTPAEVADAIAFAREHRHLPLGVRSAGHGISGRSTNRGGVVIDVGAMNSIEVLNRDERLVRIGPAATWKQVAAALGPYGWALGSGDYGGVGVGGLATAGGIGLLSRQRGLTIDHLRAAEIVLADGNFVRASAEENPDLFWAIRGAGANFGVVTAFEFEVDEVGDVGWAQLVLVSEDIESSLHRYGELAAAAPRDTTVFLVTGKPRDGYSVIQLYAVVDNPDPDVVIERLTPFLDLGALAQQQVVMTPYAGVMSMAADVGPAGHHGFGEPNSRSAFLPEMTPEFAHDAAQLLESGAVYFFEMRAMGGAIADVPTEATAFSHRDPAFQLAAMGGNDARLNEAWDPLRQHFDGLYLSFETDRRPERLLDAFPGPVLDRLRHLKRRYDPTNLFRDNFNVDPDAAAAAEKENLS